MSTARMQIIETLSHLFHPRRSNNHRPRLLHPESYFSFIGVTLGFALFIIASKAINPQMGLNHGHLLVELDTAILQQGKIWRVTS